MAQSGTPAGGTSAGMGETPDATAEGKQIREPGLNVCMVCNTTFDTQDDYQHHVRLVHPGTTAADATTASTVNKR